MISTTTSVHGSLPVKDQREDFDVLPRQRASEGFIKDAVNRLERCSRAECTLATDRTAPRVLRGWCYLANQIDLTLKYFFSIR